MIRIRKLLLGGWLVYEPDPARPDNPEHARIICEAGTAADALRLAGEILATDYYQPRLPGMETLCN